MKNATVYLLLFITQISFTQNAWKLVRSDEGINVFSRTVEGSKFLEYKTSGYFDSSISSIIAALKNPEQFDQWMPDTYAHNLESEGDTLQVHYVVSKAPWPLRDRDGIYQFRFFPPEPDGKTVIKIQGLPNYLPRQKQNVRVERVEGTWELLPQDDGSIAVHYYFHLEPGGRIPASLAKKPSINVSFATFENLKRIAQLPRYQDQKFSFLPIAMESEGDLNAEE